MTRLRGYTPVLALLAGLAAVVLGLIAIFQAQPASDTIDLLGWAAFSGGVGVALLCLPPLP
jgi:hypothetical protein